MGRCKRVICCSYLMYGINVLVFLQLFALGYGIRIEDVEKKDAIRSITGEKDYL